jgi:hypothetical protein
VRPPRFIPLCALTPTDRFQHAIARLAWELGGYEDIHASARFRRDLLRRNGPAVVDEALSCADQKTRIGFTLNGRAVSGDAEPRMLLADFRRQVVGPTGTHVGCEHGV